MCISVFYAQVLGLWLFFISLAMLIQHHRFKKIATDSLTDPILTFLGILMLGIGLLIVISHNLWVNAWPVVVTIVGWAFVFQGIMRIFWPEAFIEMIKSMTAKFGYTVVNWIWLIVGLYLTWAGFFGNQ